MPEHWLILTISLIVTYLYGSVFTLLFLDVDLQEPSVACSFGIFSFINISAQLAFGYFSFPTLVVLIYPLIVHLPLLLLCIFYYKKTLLVSLSALMMCYFLTAPRYILAELIIFVFPQLPCGDHFGKIIASLILVYPIYKWVCPILKRGFRRSRSDIMHFFVPLIMIYSFSYLLYVYTDLLKTNGILMVEIIFSLFCIIILYYIKNYFISIDDMIEKENRNHILELSYGAVKKQLDVLTKSNEQTRILRHDIRHYATMIEQYAQLGEYDKIIDISKEITGQNQAATVQNYCSNQSVNLLLSNYVAQFSALNVSFSPQLIVPKEIFVQDLDLCLLLGNALDNALKSIAKCKEERFLHLILHCDENKLFMELKNSCETAVVFRNDLPVSTKQGHGYGSKSIRYIAEKYHGLCSFDLSENIFTTKAILHN